MCQRTTVCYNTAVRFVPPHQYQALSPIATSENEVSSVNEPHKRAKHLTKPTNT